MYKQPADKTLEKVVSYVTDNHHTREIRPKPAVARSWQRCLESHGLQPEQGTPSRVLSEKELASVTDDCAGFFHIASRGVTSLQHKMWPSGYAILLADSNGATLAAGIPNGFDDNVGKHLITGACWSEKQAGTNGIGTCLLERQAITVHRQEHFLSNNSLLSCSAAPIFSPLGDLLGCLNATTTTAEGNQQQQLLSLQLVISQSLSIEDEYLRSVNPDSFIVTVHLADQAAYANHPVLLAVNERGRIVGANRVAFSLSRGFPTLSDQLLGLQLEQLCGESIDSLLNKTAGGRQTITLVLDNLGEVFIGMQLPHYPQQTLSVSKPKIRREAQAKRRHPSLSELCVDDPRLRDCASMLKKVMNQDIAILLRGETGTGKEAFAHAIHHASNRRNGPFVALNCAAIPESLIESELFGYRSGSFTGASKTGMKGKLQQANGGTLFLDEIGDMPLELQTRLLRVLAEREIQALGSDETIRLDLQLVSATHQDLMQLVTENKFRMDLFYRLNGVTLELPALRERTDIEQLSENLLRQESDQTPLQGAYVSVSALNSLKHYRWPGNIRQLINVLRLARVTAEGQQISLHHLPQEIRTAKAQIVVNNTPHSHALEKPGIPEKLRVSRDKHEAEQLLQQLRQHKWNISRTAKNLGLSRSSIYRKMKKFQITNPHEYM